MLLLRSCCCPAAVLVEVVQDACALLECRQPLELCAAMGPVQDLAALVPRMERFIGDVCGVSSAGVPAGASTGNVQRHHVLVSAIAGLPPCMQAVFQRGLAHVPEALRQDNPSDVPAILAAWIAGARRRPHPPSHKSCVASLCLQCRSPVLLSLTLLLLPQSCLSWWRCGACCERCCATWPAASACSPATRRW